MENFDINKKYKFSLRKFIDCMGLDDYFYHRDWVDECSGEYVAIMDGFTYGYCLGYEIESRWCEEVN